MEYKLGQEFFMHPFTQKYTHTHHIIAACQIKQYFTYTVCSISLEQIICFIKIQNSLYMYLHG